MLSALTQPSSSSTLTRAAAAEEEDGSVVVRAVSSLGSVRFRFLTFLSPLKARGLTIVALVDDALQIELKMMMVMSQGRDTLLDGV